MEVNVPEIRLKGFTEPWIQRKLGEIADIRTGPFGSTLHAEDYVNDGIPIITTEHFKSGMLPKEKTDIPQVSDEDYKRLHSYTLNTDDIVFSRVGSVDINALVSDIQNGWLFSGRVLRVRTHDNIDSQYLHYELSTVRAKNDVISRAVGQTMPSINTDILKETTIFFPIDVNEQIAIGEFLHALDENITLNEKKLDKLKQLKKGYLQQMFPRVGEVAPKVRFEGFDEPWSIRALGEISKIKTGASDVQDANPNGEFPFFVRSEKIERSSRYLFDGEAILVPGEGRIGDIYHYVNGKFDFHQRVYKISDFAKDVNGKFILYTMQKTFKQHAMTYTVKATVDSLRLPMLVGFNLQLPSLQEQTAIGNFFYNLDSQITTQSQKVEQLKELKAAYLQKMFV